ncbi:hypothetical protein AOLI_G00109440 [Acnodon oligacanthus]
MNTKLQQIQLPLLSPSPPKRKTTIYMVIAVAAGLPAVTVEIVGRRMDSYSVSQAVLLTHSTCLYVCHHL